MAVSASGPGQGVCESRFRRTSSRETQPALGTARSRPDAMDSDGCAAAVQPARHDCLRADTGMPRVPVVRGSHLTTACTRPRKGLKSYPLDLVLVLPATAFQAPRKRRTKTMSEKPTYRPIGRF